MLELANFANKPQVVREKGPARLDFSRYESLADEDFACGDGVVARIENRTVLVEGESVERAALGGDHFAPTLFPTRIACVPAHEVARRGLDPLGLYVGERACEETRSLHDFARKDPAPRLLGANRPRPEPELDPARAEIGRRPEVAFRGLRTDVAQQAGKKRTVHLFIGCGRSVLSPAEFFDDRIELFVDVAPLAHAAGREETAVEFRVEFAVALLFGLRLFVPAPELHKAQEVRTFVGKFLVCTVGRFLLVERSFARILHRKPRADDEEFRKASEFASGQQHASELRVDGETREFAADLREFTFGGERTEFLQNRDPVRDRARRRRLEEGKLADVAELERLGAQNDRGKIRAEDFRIRKGGTAREVLFVIESNADAFGHAAASARALIGGRLTHGFDEKLIDLAAVRVALHARHPRIDHVADPRNRDRSFGDVRREHDATKPRGFEDLFLVRRGESRKEREDFHLPHAGLSKELFGLADFPLARQKDEDVAPARHFEFAHGVFDRFEHRAVVRLVDVVQGTPADFDGIGAARNVEDRCRLPVFVGKVLGKTFRVDRRGRDDHLEVGALRQKALQVTEQKVDVDASLVRFVDDDRVVGAKKGIGLGFRKENPVRHEFDRRPRMSLVGKAHLVADDVAQVRLQFFGDALRNRTCRNAARLRVGDHARFAAAGHHGDLRELRRFARPRLTADDDDAVVAHGANELFAVFGDGESRHQFEGRHGRAALGVAETPVFAAGPVFRRRLIPDRGFRRSGRSLRIGILRARPTVLHGFSASTIVRATLGLDGLFVRTVLLSHRGERRAEGVVAAASRRSRASRRRGARAPRAGRRGRRPLRFAHFPGGRSLGRLIANEARGRRRGLCGTLFRLLLAAALFFGLDALRLLLARLFKRTLDFGADFLKGGPQGTIGHTGLRKRDRTSLGVRSSG